MVLFLKMDKNNQISSVVAKSDDGTIQITFSIPYETVKKGIEESLNEYAKEAEIPGFRKGNAPLEKVREKVPQASLIEHALGHILPQAFGRAIEEHKIKLAILPRFELVKAKEGETWEVSGKTCELPEVNLGDYKKEIVGEAKAKTIWTPGKDDQEKPKEKSQEEKEQEVIKLLLERIKVAIPKILIDEEVNSRLSNLLDRIERLGLNLDSYLSSVGKNPEILRKEYEMQAQNTISLELILNKIAEEEKINISETQIDEVIKTTSGDPKLSERLNTPEQRRMIKAVLGRKAALDSLVGLL